VRIVRLVMALLVAVTTSVAIGAPVAHAAGATLSGSVLTPQYQFVAGATIEVDGVAVATTGFDGQFITPEIEPGQHQIRAVLEGFGPSAVLTLEVVDGFNQTGLFLVLQPRSGTVSGTTRDASGFAVGGAALSLDGVSIGVSDGDGAFSIPDVAGGFHTLLATSPGYNEAQLQYIFVDGDLTIDPSVGYLGGTISGTTTTSTGQIVGNADVLVDGVAVTTSDVDGNFTTPPVSGGWRLLSASAVGYAQPDTIGVLVNGDVTGQTVSVGSAGGVLSGVVRNQQGVAVAGASVVVDYGPPITSGADGTYDAGLLSGGWHTVLVSAPGYSNGGTSVFVDGDTTLDVTLGPALAVVSGVVRDSLGNPVAGATVSVTCCVPSVTSAADGSYSISLSSGPVFLSAFKPGYSGASGTFLFVNGDTTVDLSVGAAPSVITGRVTDLAGDPLAGISYWVDFNVFGAATTGADGVYRVEVQGGTHTVSFRDPSGAYRDFTTTPIDASSPEVVRDVALVPRLDNLRGVVTAPDGTPVEGATVTLFNGTTQQPMRITTADGRFSFPDVLAGSYQLQIQPPFGSTDLLAKMIPITIVDGEVVDLTVQLAAAAVIDLTITAGGAPGSALVYLFQDLEFDRQIGFAQPDANGRITFGGLDAGSYFLQINSEQPGYASEYYPNTTLRSRAQRLQLGEGQRLVLSAPLERAAEITGTAFGPDGIPAAGQVQALAVGATAGDYASFGTCNRFESTDSEATYRVSCLHPSMKYIVQAVSNGVDYAGQFYPKTENPADATRFSPRPGQIISNINFRLRPAVPDMQLKGISPQYFQAGTTTRGVQLFGANFPKDPGALRATVATWFGLPEVAIKVTKVIDSSHAIATVTVSSTTSPLGQGSFPLSIVLSRFAGPTTFCENCLFVGDAGVSAATLSGRVTNAGGSPVGGIEVVATNAFGSRRVTYTGADGRWQIGGLQADTYTVSFVGTAKWVGQFWRQSATSEGATPVVVAAGESVTGLNGRVTRRDAIQITSITQTPTPFFQPIEAVLNGAGLDPIAGGFRVFVEVNGFRQSMAVTHLSSTSLRVNGFLFQQGTFDLIVEWDGTTGVESRRFAAAITVAP
jgi:hypothetical protein